MKEAGMKRISSFTHGGEMRSQVMKAAARCVALQRHCFDYVEANGMHMHICIPDTSIRNEDPSVSDRDVECWGGNGVGRLLS
jgi:hypothetical protein